MHDDDPVTLYGTLAEALQSQGIAYIEVVENTFQGNEVDGRPEPVIDAIRSGRTIRSLGTVEHLSLVWGQAGGRL